MSTGDRDDLERQRQQHRRTAEDLRRALRVTEVVGTGLFALFSSLAYRQRRLRMRARGAVASWENDLAHNRPLRAGGGRRR